MTLFRGLFDRVLNWSQHPRATVYLCGLSFAESTFFPIPPDVMLIPMMMARLAEAWRLAFFCTVASVTGGLFGYLIGALAFQWVEPLLLRFGYHDVYLQALAAFDRFGFWFILAAGFSPIPYKVFTISAGVIGMPLLPFFAGSVIGRGGRFFLEAGVIRFGGEEGVKKMRRWIDQLGWILVALVLGLVVYLKFFQR